MPGDISYASVSLILHGDGADGASTFTDSSSFARTTTNSTGTATNSTAKIKFGSASLRFDGSDIISTGSASDWSWMHQAGGRFTWEAWVSCDSFAADRVLFSTSNSSTGNQGLYVALTTGRGLAFQIYNATGAAYVSPYILFDGAPGSFPNDTNFHHVAIQWDQTLASGNLTWYVDGVLCYTGTKSANAFGSGAATAPLKHGGYATTPAFLGYMDDIRLTKDVIRYSADFTPPTEAFPDAPADVESVIAAPAVLGAPSVFGAAQVAAWSAVPAVLGAPSVYGAQSAAWAAVPSVLGTPYAMGSVPLIARAAAASPLGTAYALAYHDFSALLGDTVTHYVMDLTTPGGTVRVPISSWQATLQTGASCYVQCVIPACLDWSAAINAADEFVVSRIADVPTAQIEYEMARSPIGQVSMARGPTNFTATLSGYAPAFAEDEDPPDTFDRTLADVRSVTTGTSPTRVRCAIDWLLRPGQRAYYGDGASFVTRYINYYVPATGDAYMDVGE